MDDIFDMPTKEFFYGLADNNGIESVQVDTGDSFGFSTYKTVKDINAEQFAMCIKATANSQKNAVVFRCEMNFEDGTTMIDLINAKKNSEALVFVKEKALKIQLATYGTTKQEAKKRWDAIPNASANPLA